MTRFVRPAFAIAAATAISHVHAQEAMPEQRTARTWAQFTYSFYYRAHCSRSV